MKKYILSFLIFQFFVFLLSGQDSIIKTKSKDIKTKYFNSSFGIVYSSYRDEATSPLFYNGAGIHLGLGFSNITEKSQNEISFNINLTANLSKIPENQLYPQKKLSFFLNTPIYFHHLSYINKWSTEKKKILIGGAFVSNFNSRINPSFQNAAGGIEFLNNFMLSTKVEFDISRKNDKVLKVWFLKKNLKPEERSLNVLLNIGLLNFNYRPNYSYLSDSEINGSNTNWVKYYLNNYQSKMNGWALNSSVEYVRYKENGNALKWSYNWSAFTAPGNFEPFQMAHHNVKFTLMFKR